MSELVVEAPQELGEFVPAPPGVETILHSAGMEVRTVPMGPNPNDPQLTLLRFHTPGHVYTVKLDEGGVQILVKALGGSANSGGIVIARPGDVPLGRG